MERVLPILWIAFTIRIADGVFLQPPKPVLSPLNAIAYFNCTVVNATINGWNLQFNSGNQQAYMNWPLHRVALTARGIQATQSQAGSRMDSTLYINSTNANNVTSVTCCTTDTVTQAFICSNSVTLTVYNSPSPPRSLAITAIAEGKIAINWTAPFSFGIRLLKYKVFVKNEATGEVFESNWTDSETFEYRHHLPEDSCGLMQFTVIAKNPAGLSDASQPLIKNMPTVPQILSDNATVKSVHNTTAYFYITVLHCQDYPVGEYFIKLDTTLVSSSFILGPYSPSNSDKTEIKLYLQPNMKYIYTITAVNMVGNSTSSPQALYTTDVQSSTITGSDHQLNVTCFFAEGTQARGCAVCLEKSGVVVYKMVPRVNETAKGVIRTEFSVDCYNISVVDWEEDGSIGSLGVPVNNDMSLQTDIQSCKVSPSSDQPSLPEPLTPHTFVTTSPSPQSSPGISTTSDHDASLLVSPDFSSAGSIIAGVVCGVAILAVVAVVMMVLGCHLKTRKMVISVMFPQSSEIDPKFTVLPHTPAIPNPEPCLSCQSTASHNEAIPNENIEMVYYDVIQTSNMTSTTTSSGPQPYEELMRPCKSHPPNANSNALHSDYALLSQLPLYSVLESNSWQRSHTARDSLHDYCELEAPPLCEHIEGTVYEGLYESLPTAGSNV